MLSSASPVLIGQILAGKYRIERVLGEGGMGVVVEAHDTSLERRVAIKFLLADFAKHPEATQRFMREARAAVKIQSEHVARVIDVSTLENGAPYMVMEFLDGSDLSQVIESGGALPLDDAALYVIQACEALAEAHAHGIIHRDLKPANLFLAQQAGGSRKIKVLDFGISKTLSATDPGLLGSLTRTSSMMGSPLYMSPEQMKNARDVDLRTDIWALGVILYECMTGKTPFSGGSIPEISAKILLEEPPRADALRPEMPATLAAIALKALAKEPAERFANVAELALALLPFAPSRARTNVERIVRVLGAAGMADEQFLASLAPAEGEDAAAAASGPRSLDAARADAEQVHSGKRKQATLANWGQTRRGLVLGPSSGTRRTLIAAGVSVLTIAAGIAVLARSASQEGEAPALGAALPTATVPVAASSAPAGPKVAPISDPAPESAATQPSAAPPAPPAAASEREEPLEARAAKAEATTKAASSAAVKAAVSSRAKPAARAAASTSARKPSKSKAPETSHSVDFKSKFGSRK